MKRMNVLVFLLCVATAITLPAQTYTALSTFDDSDGASPYAGLVQATDGNFYGTTFFGGAANAGTVFKVTPSGTLTTLYSFCSKANCADGQAPFAGLVQATNGDFYGTTYTGGARSLGTVFRITSTGKLTTLHSFSGTDGEVPYAALIQAANGDLYGTTFEGGAELDGTIFKITPNGTLTTLHSFSGTDGEHPTGALVQATDGDFYGTTLQAGARGYGTVFKITPSGTLTILYSFCSTGGLPCSDGENPYGGLVQAANGNFYGTTQFGGATLECGQAGCGTVFKITPTGTLTTLHHFVGTDGWQPYAALVRATDGNLYGTTVLGGPAYVTGGAVGWGTIFKITPSGALTTLYSFCAQGFPCPDGVNPYAGLMQATDGSFYGTAESGGVAGACTDGIGCGAVFSLSVGLEPFRLHASQP